MKKEEKDKDEIEVEVTVNPPAYHKAISISTMNTSIDVSSDDPNDSLNKLKKLALGMLEDIRVHNKKC